MFFVLYFVPLIIMMNEPTHYCHIGCHANNALADIHGHYLTTERFSTVSNIDLKRTTKSNLYFFKYSSDTNVHVCYVHGIP